MKRFPILLNYNPSEIIGWVELNDDSISEELLLNCAIVPGARKGRDTQEEFKVENFGLIARSTVDVREGLHRQ